MNSNIMAAVNEISLDDLERLRVRYVRELEQTHGKI